LDALVPKEARFAKACKCKYLKQRYPA